MRSAIDDVIDARAAPAPDAAHSIRNWADLGVVGGTCAGAACGGGVGVVVGMCSGALVAGDAAARYQVSVDGSSKWASGRAVDVYGGNLHMHERGASGGIEIAHANGDRDCLLQHRVYDFAWHGEYLFDQPHHLVAGDVVTVECVFDNSASHQRLVDGLPETPRDLNGGDDEEMCVGFLTVALPP